MRYSWRKQHQIFHEQQLTTVEFIRAIFAVTVSIANPSICDAVAGVATLVLVCLARVVQTWKSKIGNKHRLYRSQCNLQYHTNSFPYSEWPTAENGIMFPNHQISLLQFTHRSISRKILMHSKELPLHTITYPALKKHITLIKVCK